MRITEADTVWERGRFDAAPGPRRVLFGRMYEDAAIELGAFQAGGRILCIASAGCTAMQLAVHHEVVAVDVNPAQLAYAQRRFAGDVGISGTAEHLLSWGRRFAPLAGWSQQRIREFLKLQDTVEQCAYWHDHLDTRRFRAAFDGLLSVGALGSVYASPFLDVLPAHFGAVLRGRMERCFALHANRTNPYARALLLGEFSNAPAPAEAQDIRSVLADAATFLENQPSASFDGFALSNILDGASAAYRERLLAAVRRTAARDAVLVLRSFREAPVPSPGNRAAEDRSMLWGVVDVREAATPS